MLLEDVERIEVISGPGATLWGANAVNGVINVITRPARDTQGALVTAGGGNREQTAAVRYGGAFGERGHLRVYGKAIRLEETKAADGHALLDRRRSLQAGLPRGLGRGGRGLTLQGDVYDSRSEDRGSVLGFRLGRVELSGVNLLSRWARRIGERLGRSGAGVLRPVRALEAVLFQPEATSSTSSSSTASAWAASGCSGAAGYRHGERRGPGRDPGRVPSRPSRSLSWGNVFVQDEIRLTRDARADAGRQARAQRLHRMGVPAERAPRLEAGGDAPRVGRRVARGARAGAAGSRRHRSVTALRHRRAELRVRGRERLRARLSRPARRRGHAVRHGVPPRLGQAPQRHRAPRGHREQDRRARARGRSLGELAGDELVAA